MSITLFKRKPIFLLYGAGIVLLGAATFLSWNNASTKPEQVFWSMMSQSLATSGVTIQSNRDNGSSKMKQTIQFSMGGQNTSHSVTVLSQPGTSVEDEIISTPKVAYTRYKNVKTDQKRPDGKTMDFSSINGVWAKGEEGTGGQVFAQDVLGTGLPLGGVAVPIANLNPELREKLIRQIKDENVYRTSFAAAKKEQKNGRTAYIYTVNIKPVAYASMMKSLAKAIGVHDLDNLDPQTFAGKEDFQMLLTVDVHSRHLLTAEAVGADIKQAYSGYDLPVAVALPTNTISTTELQNRLTKIQQ